MPTVEYQERIGLVPQEDIVDRNLTVRELLEFNAYARLDNPAKGVVDAVVQEVLSDLAITSIADTVIGGGENVAANISGGELKRVNIACELVSLRRPAILLLDEPTSGLDAAVAEELVKVLKNLTLHGVTVCLVLQQPRPEIFSSLDKVFLMILGGSIVFEGPAVSAASHLASFGFKQKDETSDADFCIDVLNNLIASDTPSTSTVDLAVSWRSSPSIDVSYMSFEVDDEAIAMHASNSSVPVSSFFRIFWLQAWRAFVIRMRHQDSLVVYASLAVLMAAALSSGFSVLIQKSFLKTLTPPIAFGGYYPSPISNLSGRNAQDLGFQQLLFFMSSALGTASSLAAVPLLSVPLSLVKREDLAGIPVLTFACGRIFADILNVVWIAFVFAGVWVLFGHAGTWYNWIAVIVATAFASSGIGYVCTVSSSPGYASTASILLTFVCCVFSGVSPTLKQVQDLHVINWVWYISFGTWTAEATYLTWTEYLLERPWIRNEVVNAADYYGYEISHNMQRSLGWLFAIGIFWRVVAASVLYFKIHD